MTAVFCHQGYMVVQLVEALRYKLEGYGFDSLEFFIGIIPPATIWACR